jgi:3-oxoacyl-[acyl-carrier protein] reductase
LSHGRVALVTGASRGIGRAVALKLASDGFRVAINYQNSASAAQEVLEQIRASGGTAMTARADVSSAEQVKELFEAVSRELGPVEVLVNNAGITRDNLLMRMSDEEWDSVVRTNLNSVFFCTRAAIRTMMKARFGRIVAMSSVSGLAGNAGQANYAAAKAGILGIIKSIAREAGSRGVTANVIAPGYVETDMTASLAESVRERALAQIPAGRYGLPEDVASVAAFLASDGASYINGQVIAVDGGMTM